MKNLTIEISGQPSHYDIVFEETLVSLDKSLKAQIKRRNYLVVTDRNIYEKSPFFRLNDFKNHLLVLPPGESEKKWETVVKILDKAFELDLDRQSVFVAISGGVYGDMVGFASAVFMRGVPFIQVPTSLLAMVDSSVGGKTGFDCAQGKNLIGAFHQPEKVLCAADFLKTLPHEELKNGFCEMVKHGIVADEIHFKSLESMPSLTVKTIMPLIRDSIAIKQKIVEQDEKEAGIRGYLNLGHTFGHAIEQLSDFKIPHGQAVAMGCVMAAEFAYKKEISSAELVAVIRAIFEKFEIGVDCEFSQTAIFKAMRHDKKKKDGHIRLILPEAIGRVRYYEMADEL